MSEREMIRLLSRIFATGEVTRIGGAARGVVRLGIGDDAAILRPARGQLVWTVDSSVEGVHFDRRFLSLGDVGARSFHAAVSDIAAMGARPVAVLSSLVVPAALGGRAVREIARAQAEAARELGAIVVGGNLSSGGELSVTTTVLGVAKRPLTRAGARRGDEVWLLGDVGLAAAGLRLLAVAGRARRGSAARACIAAWRRPRALVAEGLRLARGARAAIDVSDGLAGDAGHLAEASGVRVVIEETRLRRVLKAELLEVARDLRIDPLALALEGGEDYALVGTGPRARKPRAARVIGRVVAGHGVVLESPDGEVRSVVSGFDHFAVRKR